MSTELQIEDLQTGDGKAVVKGALITAHYTGWLEDGTVFDSSVQKGRPFQCVIGTGRVIKGWDLGLMGMRVGGASCSCRHTWATANAPSGAFRPIPT